MYLLRRRNAALELTYSNQTTLPDEIEDAHSAVECPERLRRRVNDEAMVGHVCRDHPALSLFDHVAASS